MRRMQHDIKICMAGIKTYTLGSVILTTELPATRDTRFCFMIFFVCCVLFRLYRPII